MYHKGRVPASWLNWLGPCGIFPPLLFRSYPEVRLCNKSQRRFSLSSLPPHTIIFTIFREDYIGGTSS